MITIVTGTSGAGKTTLKEYFLTVYGNQYAIYDFDDVGVPPDADEVWRKETTQWWIQKLEKNKQDIILFGQVVPDEIVGTKDDKLFLLLEADWELIVQRLQDRGRQEDMIRPYKTWTDHIKTSVLQQKHYAIISTVQPVEESAKSIHITIQKYVEK